MAKSQIIKDLANSEINIFTALKRTKILLNDIGDEASSKWVEHEISGYPEDVEPPVYRKIHGELRGSYFEGSIATHIQYTNVPLPLGNMKSETRELLLTATISQGLDALKEMLLKLEKDRPLVKQIPADYYPMIAMANNNLGMMISSAYVELNMPDIYNIIPTVVNKLLNILIYLEKQFGNLDQLDIDTGSKKEEELKNILENIYIIIYNDKSIKIGNDNSIENSDIASSLLK